MFTRLRNRFLVLNMCMTSLVIVAAFSIIYFITYRNVTADIDNKLNSRSEVQVMEGVDSPDDAPSGKTSSNSRTITASDPLSFFIEVNAGGSILTVDSFLDLPDEAYRLAAETAWSNPENRSAITLDGKQWRYRISPIRVHVIRENGQQYTLDDNRFTIVFLDVTASNRTLLELLTTLLGVGLITLAVIFAVSLYFANRAIQPLAEVWEKQKRFVADASHELKTPLSIINANYDALMANQEETIKSQIKWLGYIKIGTDRLAKLIHDLLTLARIEDSHADTQKAPFHMSRAIRDTILSMEAAAIEKGIRLSHSIEPDLVIPGDAERVKQVVAILFDNAIKYTNENGWIEVSLLQTKRQAIFSIKNSGRGIAESDLPKVFDRFFRADPSRTHENGSYGLGLSIAKAIMDRLGGDIRITSTEGEWTTCTFTLGMQ